MLQWSVGVLICLEDPDFSSVGLIPRSWIAALCGGHILISWGTSVLFAAAAVPLCIPPAVHEGSNFLILTITCLFNNNPDRYWWWPHYVFQFVFPWWLVMLNIIRIPVAICVCPLRECLFMLSPLHPFIGFVLLLLSCIFWRLALYQVHDLQIYSPIQ